MHKRQQARHLGRHLILVPLPPPGVAVDAGKGPGPLGRRHTETSDIFQVNFWINSNSAWAITNCTSQMLPSMKGCGKLMSFGGVSVTVPAAYGTAFTAEQNTITGRVSVTLAGPPGTGSIHLTASVHPVRNVVLIDVSLDTNNTAVASVPVDVTTWVVSSGGTPVTTGSTAAARPVAYATRSLVPDQAGSAMPVVLALASTLSPSGGSIANTTSNGTQGVTFAVTLAVGRPIEIVTSFADNVGDTGV